MYLSMVVFTVKVTVKRTATHQCSHPCKEKWTKSSNTQFKYQIKSPVLLVKHKNYACLCGMMSTHQINSVTSPSVQVF